MLGGDDPNKKINLYDSPDCTGTFEVKTLGDLGAMRLNKIFSYNNPAEDPQRCFAFAPPNVFTDTTTRTPVCTGTTLDTCKRKQ